MGNRSSFPTSGSEDIYPAISRFKAIADQSAALESAELIRGGTSIATAAQKRNSPLIRFDRRLGRPRDPYTASCGATFREAGSICMTVPSSTANPELLRSRACPALLRSPVGPPRNPDACFLSCSRSYAAVPRPPATGPRRKEPGRRRRSATAQPAASGPPPRSPACGTGRPVPRSIPGTRRRCRSPAASGAIAKPARSCPCGPGNRRPC